MTTTLQPGEFESARQPRSFGPEATAEELAQALEGAVTEVELQSAEEERRTTDLHRRLFGFFQDEMERQAHNRYQMALDEDYFDGLQWDDEEIMKLLERMQAPLVYNAIKPTVLWILGTERRTRTDGKVLARENDPEAEKDAELKSATMKYVADVNHVKFTDSDAFQETVVSGLSWLEDGATNNPGKLPVYSGYESWKNVLHDSCGRDKMGEDWRYLFRFRDIDEDIAKSMFPLPWQHAHIALSCSGADTDRRNDELMYLNSRIDSVDWPSPARTSIGRRNFIDVTAMGRTTRRRMRLIEAWYRVPESCFVCRGAVYDGKTFDPKNREMRAAYDQGTVMLVNQTQMKMRVAFMSETKVLEDRASPYKHDAFPFTPLWCYRRGRDGAPYGVVREMRDPQDSLNKHLSKNQWLMASNQIHATEDATTDWKRLRKQADKPNGTLIYKKGSEFKIERHQAEAGQHAEMAKFDLGMIRENYGGNMESLGVQSNASSGKAILARQEQGTVQIQPIFDNFMFSREVRRQKQLSLIEQYMTDERVIRTTGKQRGKYDYLKVNEAVQDPATGQWSYKNDLTARQADYVLDEQDWRASLRQAMAESMADMIAKMPPDIAFRFLDMWVELVDIPNKEEYVRRIRQLNGMGDNGDAANAEVDKVKQEAQQQVQMVQQQAQQAMDGLTKENEALKKSSAALQGQVQKQAVQLTDKAEELRLREIEINDRHAEAMAKINHDQQKQRDAVDQNAADRVLQLQNIDRQATDKKTAETDRHAGDAKALQEHLADLHQTVQELAASHADAQKIAAQKTDNHGQMVDALKAVADRPIVLQHAPETGTGRKKITLSNGQTATIEPDNTPAPKKK